MFPYLIFVSLVAWAMGVLNAEGRFAAPAAAPVLLNIGIIGAAFGISPLLDEPIIGIGFGVLLGGIAQIIIQVPSLRKVGQSLKPQNFSNDENIQRLLKLLGRHCWESRFIKSISLYCAISPVSCLQVKSRTITTQAVFQN